MFSFVNYCDQIFSSINSVSLTSAQIVSKWFSFFSFRYFELCANLSRKCIWPLAFYCLWVNWLQNFPTICREVYDHTSQNNQEELALHFCFPFMWNETSVQIAQRLLSKSIQNECAADIADTVQRGLGMLPQQADLRRLHRRENRENEWTCTGLHCLPILCCWIRYNQVCFPHVIRDIELQSENQMALGQSLQIWNAASRTECQQ